MTRGLEELKGLLAEIEDLNRASTLLSWDLQTRMPPGGAETRANQSSALARLYHEKSTSPVLGRLLDALGGELLDPSSLDAALVRVARRDYER